MSYDSTITAMDPAVNPVGSAGSALKNPAAAGHAAVMSDETIVGLKFLVDKRIEDANMGVVKSRQVADLAYDDVTIKGLDKATPDQVAEYDRTRTLWTANPSDPALFDQYEGARQKVFDAGKASATPAELEAVSNADVGVSLYRKEAFDATQYKEDTIPALDNHIETLVNGDPAATDPTEKLGISGTAAAKLETLPSDVATLSGGEAAVSHIARVDGTAPENPTNACLQTSLIARGLKALTDSGKLILDFGKKISSAIGGVLGDIKDWTVDKLKMFGDAIKGVVSSIGNMVKDAMATFKGWVQDGLNALKQALTIARNKAFMNFLSFDDACIKESMKEVINMNNVDQAALDKARVTA